MDRTLRALAKFESSRPGLILGTQVTARGWIFLDHNFLSSKNLGYDLSNEGSNLILSSLEVGY